ncbi:carbamoyl phosphate synthase large subunit [Lactobacillus sp. ESL0681]|uniref:carbamoyl phosphate synthase large subunit n=1 Tax=Lactobacillus sp. ESL0681 TaxID=2983211 RepID=UPI0023F7DC56|nr:carbamoyl phosphate synthase large subunit [Lactobacillus sp. ESL0681]WEV40673.1 carbamoyl phosphate synthase large subunit [Lactobacillus sp. ESL0681]
MPLEKDLDKVLIIGSGPTLIGSVAETDILTLDAINALLEEDIQVVLVNPNPATISTDKRAGVTVYLEPMTLAFLKRIIRMEEPDAILSAYGSTTALTATRQLLNDGILTQMQIRLLSLNEQTLRLTSHQKMADFLEQQQLPVSHYQDLVSLDTENLAIELSNNVTFPALLVKEDPYLASEKIVFKTVETLVDYLNSERKKGDFSYQNYRLVEDLSDFGEVIVNVIRDKSGNVLFTNFADSIETVAINSGDSALVMPALTLNNDQIQLLKQIAQKIAAKLDIVGILNIHFAVKHDGTKFTAKVLTIKPRLTRSAIWAQRTSLYSVGYVVCKVALGYHLNEILDPVSGLNAAVEPIQDQVAIRLPYWSLTQAGINHYHLGKKMQASGEALGVGQNFEAAFLKALASTSNLKLVVTIFETEVIKDNQEIINDLVEPDELHLVKLLAAIASGIEYQELQQVLHLHPVYFQKFQRISRIWTALTKGKLSDPLLVAAKRSGFSNELIAKLSGLNPALIQAACQNAQITSAYLQIDGSAGFYSPKVQAYYNAFGVQDEVDSLAGQKKVLVIGMLPSQVSVTSEFDYMISHALVTLHNNGYVTILLSNNDESVATSYQVADRVYFDPITVERILDICHKENIKEVLLQFSGKKVNALNKRLTESGITILGTKGENPKDKIDYVLSSLNGPLKQTSVLTTTDSSQVDLFIQQHEFPILIGGFNNQGVKQKSAVVYDSPALQKYLQENHLSKISLSTFIEGHKYEITAISDGTDVTIPGIIEHLEQTGTHASDSIAVFKPQNLSARNQAKLIQYTIKLVQQINLRGIFTLHFLIVKQDIYLLQIKPYAGHNIAFLSQALGQDITDCATQVLTGQNLPSLGYPNDLWNSNNFIHVKMPVFSYVNYNSGNTFDSKMKSSGSVMGRDTKLAKALYKGYEASGLTIPSFGTIFISVRDSDKKQMTELAQRFYRLGFKIIATEGTANAFAEAGMTTMVVSKVHTDSNNLLEKIRQHRIKMVINVPSFSDIASGDAIKIRDEALNTHIPVFSSIETTELILNVLESLALTTQPI